MGRLRSVLLVRNRDFRWYWGGQSISVFGSYVTSVALPLAAVLTLHAGAVGVAAVSTASTLPNVLLPLLVGEWVERRRRRRMMVVCDAFRALVLASIPAAYLMHQLSVALLAAVAFLVGAASVFFEVGSFAYIPTLVDEGDVPAAVRAQQGSVTVANALGPGAAGLLTQLIGPALAIAVDAVSYLASVVGVAAARRPEPAPPQPDQRIRIWTGLVMVLRHPVLRALCSYAAGYNFAYPIIAVNLIVYAVDQRGMSAGTYGAVLTAGGVGGFVGTLVALRLARRLGYGKAFLVTLAFTCGLPLLYAPAPLAGAAFAVFLAACILVTGTGGGIANVLSITLRQAGTPAGFLGRTNGGYRLVIYGVLPIGSALGGVLGHAVGSRPAIGVGAAVLALATLPMLTRQVRGIRQPEELREDATFQHAAPPAAPGSGPAEPAEPAGAVAGG